MNYYLLILFSLIFLFTFFKFGNPLLDLLFLLHDLVVHIVYGVTGDIVGLKPWLSVAEVWNDDPFRGEVRILH